MGCRRKERLLVENIRNTTTHVCGFCLRLGCGKDFLSKILHKSALSCPLYSLTEMSLRCLALVAICFVFISTEAVSGEDVKKAVGDEVSFRPDKVVPPLTSITWKHRNGVIVVKVIEWDDDDGVSIPNPRFQGITTLDEKTGQITITNLTVEHSGLYTIDINSREQEQRFSLTVTDGDVKKAVGGTVSFRPDKLESPVTSITWKQINGVMVVKAIEWDVDDGFNTPNPRFQGITTLDEKTGQITITNLKVEHSGLYTININNKEQQQRFSLEVMDGEVKKAVGETVSFRPDKLGSPVTSFTWKQINGVMVVKVIEWDIDDGFNTPNPRFKDITTLDEKTGQITITNLKVEHSGVYTIDINNKEQQQRFTLEVMERVPKPVITIEKSSNPDVVYLRCEYSETIIWKNSAGDTLKGKKNHNPGEFITVTNTRNPENFYTCTLKNAVSEETSDPVYEGNIFGTDGEVKKAVGETVSFRPDKLGSPVTSFTWKHRNNDGVVVKAIEWDDDEGVITPNPRFQSITTLDEKTGQITITNLKVEHSGLYTIDINSREQQQRFSLTVMEPVPKPVIAIEKSNNSDVI